MSSTNEIIEAVYLKKEKPVMKSNKKGQQGRQRPNQEEQQQHSPKYLEKVMAEKLREREEKDLADQIAQSEKKAVPTKQEYEQKVGFINGVFPDQFSNGEIKQALRKFDMDVEQTIEYLSNGGKKQENAVKKNTKGPLINIPSSPQDKKQRLQEELCINLSKLKETFPNLPDEQITQALLQNNNDIEAATDYLLENIGETEPVEDMPITDIENDYITIFNQIREEEVRQELAEQEMVIDLLSKEINDEEALESEQLEMVEFKKNFSQEELHTPEVIQMLKKTSAYFKQMELLHKQNEEKLDNNEYNLDYHSQTYKVHVYKEKEIKTQKKDKFVMKTSDFPSIQGNSQGSSQSDLTKRTQLEYNCHKNEWNSNIAVFQTDAISDFGKQCIQQLSQDFPHVDLDTLIDIFAELDENVEVTRKYLLNEFGKSRVTTQEIIIKKRPQISEDRDFNLAEGELLDNQRAEFEDIYGVYTLEDLRAAIQKTTHFNKVYQIASRQGDIVSKLNLQKRFQNNLNKMSLEKMKQYFKVLFLQSIRSQKPMNQIDLHGLGTDEALDVLKDQIMYLRKLVSQNRQNELQISKNHIVLEIITGQGLHSQNGSVLKPLVVNFLKKLHCPHRVDTGAVFARIPI